MGYLQQREYTCAPTCIFQEALQGGLNTGQKISTHVLKLTSDTKQLKMVWFVSRLISDGNDRRKGCIDLPVHFSRDINVIHEALDIKWQVWGVGAHELFQLFTLLVQPNQSPWLWLDIELVLVGKFLTEMLYQSLIKVFSSKFWVRSSGQYLGDEKTGTTECQTTKQVSYRCSTQCLFSLLTLSLPLLKAHTDVWYPEWPRSTNTTFLAFSSGAGRSCL